MSIIQPQVLKGFRDFLPEYELQRQKISSLLSESFEKFGYVPIDTPVLEYTEILLGKGGGETDKQVYSFEDHGKRKVSMRFDLTVPFARFMATHVHKLYLPFKRYHINKVWRGENTQRGRYREFTQCDFDIVGVDSSSADFEIILLIVDSFQKMGIQDFNIHISHRGIFNSFLEKEGIQEHSVDVLRTVDKIKKIGVETVLEELQQFINKDQAEKVLLFINSEGSFSQTLSKLEKLSGECEGLQRIKDIYALIQDLELESYISLDTSITRGLDYYTGIVYETFLTQLTEIGSVCSGGRYNDLAGLYTKQPLPGVGASIGLDRLFAALEELGLSENKSSSTDVLLMNLKADDLGQYHRLAQKLREQQIAVEVYPETKKLKNQFTFAERKNIPLGIFLGEEELANKTYTMKNLQTRTNYENLDFQTLVASIQKELSVKKN